MPTAPRVSVVLPLYNAQDYVADAVRSVLAQSFSDFELLILNDGSTDRSRAVVGEFADPRIRIIDQENRGLIATLNRGLELASAPLVARMDADDVCMPNRLAEQYGFLQAHPAVSLLGSFIETLDEDGRTLAPVVPFPQEHEQIWASLGRRPWVMCHPAVMYRRDAALAAGGYNPAFAHAEDVEFYARMMTAGRAANLPAVLLRYRIRRSAVSGTAADRGRLNAVRVAERIDRWKPGEPWNAIDAGDAGSASAPAAADRKPTPEQIEARYHSRVGRELLRGRQWRRAAGAYLSAIRRQPLDWTAYAGLAAAALHKGAAGSTLAPTRVLQWQDAALKQRAG